jgi:uncharacterized membrane protein
VNQWVLMVVQWMHVFCGVFWLGTVLYTRLVLFPSLRTVPAGASGAVRGALVTGRNRRLTLWTAGGTVGLGILRGWLGGALSDVASPYGFTYLAAAVLGIAMLAFLAGPWGGNRVLRILYVASFPLIFTLMILMRFGL